MSFTYISINNDTEYSVTGYTGTATEVTIPNRYNDKPVTQIEVSAFKNNTVLTEIVIPNTIVNIGQDAFYNCTNLKKITFNLAEDQTTISAVYMGANVFKNCSSLVEVFFNNRPVSIRTEAFFGCKSLKYLNDLNLTSYSYIYGSAFSGCAELKQIFIPSNITEIRADAFKDCNKLTIYCEAESQPIGWVSSWNYSNRPVVWGCDKDDEGIVYINDSNEYSVVGYIESSKYFEAIIPNTYDGKSVTNISESAFYDCDSLISIDIPEGVTSIGYGAFYNCKNLTEINFNATNCADLDYGNYVFAYAGQNGTGITVSFGDSVTKIPAYLFYPDSGSSYTPKITSVIIGENVTSIGYYAFSDCYSLKSVTFAGNSRLTNMGEGAFYWCISLTSIEIPEGVTSIGEWAFSSCTLLANVTFAESSQLKSMGYGVFEGCASLQKITIPDSVTSICDGAFTSCESLVNIALSKKMESIGENMFAGCYSLESLEIPASVTSIGSYAFMGCNKLTNIVIPVGVTSIGSSAFEGCYLLTIYCEALERPSGWDEYWNSDNNKVYWYREEDPKDPDKYWHYTEVTVEGFKISSNKDKLFIDTKNFKVNQDGKVIATEGEFTGKVIATEGEFTGKVIATEGEIGGFHIMKDHLASGEPSANDPHLIMISGSGWNTVSSDTRKYAFWAGPKEANGNDSSRPFWVDVDGEMHASKGAFGGKLEISHTSNKQGMLLGTNTVLVDPLGQNNRIFSINKKYNNTNTENLALYSNAVLLEKYDFVGSSSEAPKPTGNLTTVLQIQNNISAKNYDQSINGVSLGVSSNNKDVNPVGYLLTDEGEYFGEKAPIGSWKIGSSTYLFSKDQDGYRLHDIPGIYTRRFGSDLSSAMASGQVILIGQNRCVIGTINNVTNDNRNMSDIKFKDLNNGHGFKKIYGGYVSRSNKQNLFTNGMAAGDVDRGFNFVAAWEEDSISVEIDSTDVVFKGPVFWGFLTASEGMNRDCPALNVTIFGM